MFIYNVSPSTILHVNQLYNIEPQQRVAESANIR